MRLKRMALGVSSFVVATMTIGTAATTSAHSKDSGKKQGSTQHNKNQRNTKNYNITYHINYYFNRSDKKPDRSDSKSKPHDRYAFKDHGRSDKPSKGDKHKRSHEAKLASHHDKKKSENRHYTDRQWVYDPRLCRWVEIGYNKSSNRWELIYDNDRKDSRRDNPTDNKNYSYWYND